MCEEYNQSLKIRSLCTTENQIVSTWNSDKTYTEVNEVSVESTEDCAVEFTEEKVSEILWQTFPVIIFVIGLTGNVLNMAVLWRLGVRRQPTLVFILFLAVTDSLVLVSGLPRYWILYMFDYDTRTISNGVCKTSLFCIYVSMQYSAWILVGVCLERVVKTYFPFKYRRIYSAKSVTIGLLILFLCVCIVDMHFFWTNGINDFTQGDCSSLTEHDYYFDENVFVYIDFTILSAVPFIIMLISNILLTRILKKIQVQRSVMMHDIIFRRTQQVSVKMTWMLLITSIYFVITTAPISIYFIVDTYYRSQFNEREKAKLDLAWTIVYLFQFSNYSVNFFLYTACNRRFKQEFKAIICCGKRWATKSY